MGKTHIFRWIARNSTYLLYQQAVRQMMVRKTVAGFRIVRGSGSYPKQMDLRGLTCPQVDCRWIGSQ